MAEHPPPVPDGYDGPRACDPHEFGAMLDLQNLALRTLNSRAGDPARMPSMGLDWPHVYYPGNLDNIRVITHNGLVVSAVAIAPTTVRTPRGRFDSEGLLACPQLDARRVAGRLVAVVKGEGGRDLLGKELRRRGAEVIEADVYRRRAPERLVEMLDGVRESVDVVIVTSADALGNLAGAAPWTAPWLSSRVVVTVSERVAAAARARGLTRLAVAGGADAASIVEAAVRAAACSAGGGAGPGAELR